MTIRRLFVTCSALAREVFRAFAAAVFSLERLLHGFFVAFMVWAILTPTRL